MNNETLTKAKIKRAVTANLKGITSNKLYCRLIVTNSERRSPHEHIKKISNL